MTTPAAPCTHRLASAVNFHRMRCGVVLVDPAGERWTTDPALTTCRGCLRATRPPAASPDGARVGGGWLSTLEAVDRALHEKGVGNG